MMQKLIDAYELKREMYRRCIDTDEEIKKGRAKWDSGLWIRYKVFEDAITLAQRIDAVDVVRCKDCKHNSLNRIIGNTYCDLGIGLSQLYDYCSHGERKENDEL